MYEVEYKVEITETEKQKLGELFEANGFVSKKEVMQYDYYIEANPSEFGGFDLKRYRKEGGVFVFTEKIWEDIGGNKARRENEQEVSKEEFDKAIAQYPNALSIEKKRTSFSAKYKEHDIHIDMDRVKFDHSPSERYFIEAETISGDKENTVKLKKLMIEFLQESLGRFDVVESPGMFSMAYKKL